MKQKIFIATGNSDKFRRISEWLKDYDVKVLWPYNFEGSELLNSTKLSDEEERQYPTMRERALAKAKKAAVALKEKGYENTIVLGMDDTMYIENIGEIIDVRKPRDLYDLRTDNLIKSGSDISLNGRELAEYYIELTKAFGSSVIGKDFKLLEYSWKYSLAICSTDNLDNPHTIVEWSRKKYLKSLIPDNIIDSGYVLDKISVDYPDGTKRMDKVKWNEVEPKKAVRELGLRLK